MSGRSRPSSGWSGPRSATSARRQRPAWQLDPLGSASGEAQGRCLGRDHVNDTSLIRTCQEYLALGTHIALIVDSNDEAILAFRPGQPMRVLRGDDRIDVDDVLPGLAMTVRGLFEAIVPRWVGQKMRQSNQTTPANARGDQADDAAVPERS